MINLESKIKLGWLIGIMPSNYLRILFYRKIFGYKIHKSFIGWNTTIVVENADIEECKIGRGNYFLGPMDISIKKGTNIGSKNTFECGWWTQLEKYRTAKFNRSLKIGEDTLITSRHHFDVTGSFILGNGSCIAGSGSQFWTHGAGGHHKLNIIIGENCYIGSAVRFAPGSSIGNNSTVGLGSIVTNVFTNENVLIAGHPARVMKDDYDWKTRKGS